MIEQWKTIKGYSYEISNLGNIRSLDKYQDFPLFAKGNIKGNIISLTPILRKGKLLKKTLNEQGYYCVGIFKNKKVKYSLIHRLVAEAFIPNPDNKKFINHKDSNKTNNTISNLEWCTPAENNYHAWKFGALKDLSTKMFSNNHKFSDNQIIEIINLKKQTNLSNQKIAEKYNTTRRTIDRIVSGESYKWIKRNKF